MGKIVLEEEEAMEFLYIKSMMDKLFKASDDRIKKRFHEIKTFITRKENDEYDRIQYEDILAAFKKFFCASIFSGANLRDAIFGEPMINAFEKIIQDLPTEDAMEVCLHGSTMLLLEKEFLGRSIFDRLN